MAIYRQPDNMNKNDVSTIYIDQSVYDWVSSDECIAILYGEILHAAKNIIYGDKSKCELAMVVSNENDKIRRTMITISRSDIITRLERVLKYLEVREFYEDCIIIRDMLVDFNKQMDVANQ